MVKNITGGNKHKGQARKYVNDKRTSAFRVSENELEIYAQVTKMLGDGRFDAIDIEGKPKRGLIPKKFRGRHMKDNKISVNTWVLIGGREWEATQKPVYDLLEVYSEAEKHYLKTNVHLNWSKFETEEKSSGTADIEFGNDNSEYQDMIQREAKLAAAHTKTDEAEEEWINVDDI